MSSKTLFLLTLVGLSNKSSKSVMSGLVQYNTILRTILTNPRYYIISYLPCIALTLFSIVHSETVYTIIMYYIVHIT